MLDYHILDNFSQYCYQKEQQNNKIGNQFIHQLTQKSILSINPTRSATFYLTSRDYYYSNMQDLSNILLKLSQRILNVNESRKLKVAKLMLNLVDHRYFTDSSLLSISTFSQLNKEVREYYKEKFNQKISESLFYQVHQDDKFIAIYKLIMDLGLNSDQKELFLNAILDMTENEKNLLMEFVGEVVKRNEFICQNNKHQEIIQQPTIDNNNNNSSIAFYEQMFQQLKEQYKDFEKIYYELLDQHESLKKNYEKTTVELGALKEEKFQLLSDLGLHSNAGYGDIIDKYRKDVEDFSEDVAKLQKDIDEKNQLIKRKEKENQEMIMSFSIKHQQLTQSYQEKSIQLIKKQSIVEKKLEQSLEKQEQLKFEITRLKEVIVHLRKELEEKNVKLKSQEDIMERFNKMKSLHLDYMKALLQKERKPVKYGVAPSSQGGINI